MDAVMSCPYPCPVIPPFVSEGIGTAFSSIVSLIEYISSGLDTLWWGAVSKNKKGVSWKSNFFLLVDICHG